MSRARKIEHAFARSFSLFLGGFVLCNLLGDLIVPGFDANSWWIIFGRIAPAAREMVLLVGGGLLLAYGLRPRAGRLRRIATIAGVLALLVPVTWNTLTTIDLIRTAQITAGVPIPFSLLLALVLMIIVIDVMRAQRPEDSGSRLALTGGLAAFHVCAFCLAQMFLFGMTDYRRPVDAIVVFGARAYANGHPSDALADRVRTACSLVRQGYADRLILSGGPGDGDVHETEVMARMAKTLGIEASMIVRDEHGLSTQATVSNLRTILPQIGAKRILAVSHFYHLPRIKMTMERAGIEAYTVPAMERSTLSKTPLFLLREIAALGYYYLRPLWMGRGASAGDGAAG